MRGDLFSSNRNTSKNRKEDVYNVRPAPPNVGSAAGTEVNNMAADGRPGKGNLEIRTCTVHWYGRVGFEFDEVVLHTSVKLWRRDTIIGEMQFLVFSNVD
ncbi:hypothetical protein RRG08_058491 [Elysia crispata]|uniref:Uncharacterized protein n=1 Tax=Elysia crispata TaxID=231223 RepID=A0AAE0Y633_9GAST|nr:hypothetical protein RRG08_058491 [Elysia crispata]